MNWRWCRFDALGVDDLYDALALRCQVFIVEQVAFLDPDGVDRRSAHLLGRGANGVLAAYLRVVDPGVTYAEPSIGRVAVAASARGTGQGRVLMQEGIKRCENAWPGRTIRIGAQARLADFYASLGFAAVGEVYLEDGIDHIQMLRGP